MFLAALTIGFAGALPLVDLVPTASLPSADREQTVRLESKTFGANQRIRDVQLMLADLNAARAAAGLSAVTLDRRLTLIAVSHASDMVAHRFFGHESSNGLTPFDRFDRAGLKYGYAGENIALDVDEASANRELERSNEHRENILEPRFRHVGIAAVRAQDGTEIFVQDFTD